MNRLVNILYAVCYIVLCAYLIAFISGGGATGISDDAQFIGLSIIIAGCLAYGGE